MDNRAIARVFSEIADLLELKGADGFRVRAWRNAAVTVADDPTPVAGLTIEELRKLPGIGRDLAARIREIVETGRLAYHSELSAQFPPTILDLLRLQGVGPRTVAMLHRELGVASLQDLADAARAGRIRVLKGMGPRREQAILAAIAEQQRFAGRHLLSETRDAADALIAHLRERAPAAQFDAVGSLRRGYETCGDIDILATSAGAHIMDAFTGYGLVQRVLGRGDTKTSVLLTGGYQADLRLVPAESRGAALQYFTGSRAHNIALRDRALQRGFKLNEYGLFRVEDDSRLAGATEEDVYAALDLEWIPPELREGRGEIEAAAVRALPRLVDLSDLAGDLHVHTTDTDGRDDLEAMVAAARARGHRYVAITDHSRALAMANGLDEARVLEQAARIRALAGRFPGVTVLAGVECDILADGSLDLADDCLSQLDLVVASVHSHFGQAPAAMTARVLRALANPWVDVLAHPTGRLLLARDPYALDVPALVESAARHGVALEINAHPNRLDLNESHARLAHDRGVKLAISSDAHATGALADQRWGVLVARRAWLEAADVLNALPPDRLVASLRRRAAGAH